MTQPLGIIGAGMIGSTVARLATAAGLDVVIGNSRGPDTLTDLMQQLGPTARAGTAAEAAAAGDVVVVTVPMSALPALPQEALAGRTVLDTCNYYPQRDGAIDVLDRQELTSSALVQRSLPDSPVVKAMNNIAFFDLLKAARPAGHPDRSALPIAADDPGPTTVAARVLDVLGFDAVRTGPLAESWRSEPGTPVYVTPYSAAPVPEGLGQEETLRWLSTAPGPVVDTARVAELIAAAVRGAAGGVFPS